MTKRQNKIKRRKEESRHVKKSNGISNKKKEKERMKIEGPHDELAERPLKK
jgi:hypothetical protein